MLEGTDQVGFNDLKVDPGGIVRRALLFMDDGQTVSSSFALKLALLYLQMEGIGAQPDPVNPQYLRIGETTIKPFEQNDGGYVRIDAKGYQFLVDFSDPNKSFTTTSLTRLLSGEVDAEAIKDRVVLIGVAAQSVGDLFFTSHSRGSQGGRYFHGVFIHAFVTSELIRFAFDESSPIETASEGLEVFYILLWGLIGGAIGFWARSPWRFAITGFGSLSIMALAAYYALSKGWWIPLVPPAAAWIASAAVGTAYLSNQEKRLRAQLMQLFSKHISPEVAEVIWSQREQFMDGGRPRSQKLTATVLFSDMKGFTSVSEKMDPQSLLDWLNIYMESMTQLIMKYGGVVDDFAGDGIKADFGVPLPRNNEAEIQQDAVNAVNCALEMEKEMSRLNNLWQKKNLPLAGIRIGIITGPVVAGALGSSQRMKYTTIGDSVNTASRLESYDKNLAKESLCRILIGETTLRYLDSNFITEPIGQVSLKGKDEKMTVYRVFGKKA